jgi:hypothetical protein
MSAVSGSLAWAFAYGDGLSQNRHTMLTCWCVARRCVVASQQDVVNDAAGHISQSIVPALEPVGQLLVIDSQAVQ